MLLALTIISTVAAVSSALSALGLLPQRRRADPQIVVILVTSTEHQVRQALGGSAQESDPKLESAA